MGERIFLYHSRNKDAGNIRNYIANQVHMVKNEIYKDLRMDLV